MQELYSKDHACNTSRPVASTSTLCYSTIHLAVSLVTSVSSLLYTSLHLICSLSSLSYIVSFPDFSRFMGEKSGYETTAFPWTW